MVCILPTVVDCGYVKLKAFSPKTEIGESLCCNATPAPVCEACLPPESLRVVPVSQSSAVQRAGRAGRVRSGKAFRLYSEEAFHSLEMATPPEMQRVNLSSAILQLKALGIDNVARFDFISVSAVVGRGGGVPPVDGRVPPLQWLAVCVTRNR